jgi:class 3 adenylate cyclase
LVREVVAGQAFVEAARRIVDSMPAHLAVGVGVAPGPAFVGSIRSTDRLIWSAVGSTTNLAARLHALTRDLGASIALDESRREREGSVCTDFARERAPQFSSSLELAGAWRTGLTPFWNDSP